MSSKRNQKGFTLIEIVMVIILLGILAAVAIPKFVDLSTDAHDAAVDGAFGAVNSALSIAIARDKVVPIVADLQTAVLDNVTLTGDISFSAVAGGVFDIRSGAVGAGRKATITYTVVGGTPSLAIGAKGAY